MFGFWILLFLVHLLVAALPTYPYSREWGYWPGGLVLLFLVLWLVLIYLGAVAFWWPWTASPPAPT